MIYTAAQPVPDLKMITVVVNAYDYGWKLIVAIVGFANFVNLTYHHKFLHFAVKCHEFDYFHLLTSK